MANEAWRPVLGYEGYYSVSDQRRVRSEPRVILSRRKTGTFTSEIPGCVLKPYVNSNGYLIVSLCDLNAKARKFPIHRLVLTSFVGPCPAGYEACHNNGVRADARLDNLRWDTRKANHADKIAHGTTLRGERCGTSKINLPAALEIFRSRETQRVLADRFGLSQGQVCRIQRGERWQHLTSAA